MSAKRSSSSTSKVTYAARKHAGRSAPVRAVSRVSRTAPAPMRKHAVDTKNNRPQLPKNTADAKGLPADDAGGGNIDKVRDILFGGQMRDYERRFSRLEERLVQETAELKDDVRKRLVGARAVRQAGDRVARRSHQDRARRAHRRDQGSLARSARERQGLREEDRPARRHDRQGAARAAPAAPRAAPAHERRHAAEGRRSAGAAESGIGGAAQRQDRPRDARCAPHRDGDAAHQRADRSPASTMVGMGDRVAPPQNDEARTGSRDPDPDDEIASLRAILVGPERAAWPRCSRASTIRSAARRRRRRRAAAGPAPARARSPFHARADAAARTGDHDVGAAQPQAAGRRAVPGDGSGDSQGRRGRARRHGRVAQPDARARGVVAIGAVAARGAAHRQAVRRSRPARRRCSTASNRSF